MGSDAQFGVGECGSVEGETVSVRLLVVVFVAGMLAGWGVTRKFTPDWVEAVGTWVGAGATIATIIWAVFTFRSESQDRDSERVQKESEKQAREAHLAEGVTAECRHGQFYGVQENRTLTGVKVVIHNASPETVSLHELVLSGVQTTDDLPREVSFPKVLEPGGATELQIAITPMKPVAHSEFKGRPLTFVKATVVYRIGSAEWERTGVEPPRRRVLDPKA